MRPWYHKKGRILERERERKSPAFMSLSDRNIVNVLSCCYVLIYNRVVVISLFSIHLLIKLKKKKNMSQSNTMCSSIIMCARRLLCYFVSDVYIHSACRPIEIKTFVRNV